MFGFFCSSWSLLYGSLVTPHVVLQCRVVDDSCFLVLLDMLVGDSTSGWTGSGSELVTDGDSSDAQLGVEVIGDSFTASLESVIGDSSSLSRGREVETLLRVHICGLP